MASCQMRCSVAPVISARGKSIVPSRSGSSPQVRQRENCSRNCGVLVDVLRDHRKAQLELRIRLGAGKLQDDDLLFSDLDGAPLSPNAMSAAWSDYAKQIGIPEVT